MAQALIWTHALVAMLFAAVALAAVRSVRPVAPRPLLVAAPALTALWALAVAGIGAHDVATHVAAGVRDLAWLAVVFALTEPHRWRTSAFAVTASTSVLAAVLQVGAEVTRRTGVAAVLTGTALAVAMLATAGALVLSARSRLSAEGGDRGRGGRHLLIGALTAMWGADLMIESVAWSGGTGGYGGLALLRGLAFAGTGLAVAIAVHRGGEWTLQPSRLLALRGIGIAALLAVLGMAALTSSAVAALGGPYARLIQTGFVVGIGVTLLTVAATPWLRAWAKVMVAKHLFSHRYDYRVAWMRFTATLAAPDAAARPLAERVVRAMAELTDSPAGLLLTASDAGLEPGATWRWESAPADGASAALAARIAADRRIVALDEVRRGLVPDIAIDVPGWLVARDDAWALVPLVHGERLVGAIALARPLVDRALDWEDFDLLGIAARQVAGYLAEDAAHAALAEARRFEEFNRRFAFLLHDLKNLVSQMALVARNAERHAENPDFRADMIATLRDTSQRMSAILARLTHQPAASGEPVRAIDLRALAERIADARRAQHPIVVDGIGGMAQATSAALETAIGHLVQNAVEASAPGVPVTLAVADGSIDVIDRGIGMAPGFVRDELFKPFASAKPNGFGLGAYEARALVVAMGGRLEVESREGEGTRFRILLPRATYMEEAA